MKHLIGAIIFLFGSLSVNAQNIAGQDIQIHGFATQAFLVSNNNNYLGMNTRNFSAGWTEAAVNINDQVTGKLRAGLQLHYTRLGVFGGENVSIDWALGDYKFNRYVGIRAGKVKVPWGLYNDVQDYDPGYMWALLPETMYGIDTRATNLSVNGALIYGRFPLGPKAGKLAYNVYIGDYTYSSDDGYITQLNESGYFFRHRRAANPLRRPALVHACAWVDAGQLVDGLHCSRQFHRWHFRHAIDLLACLLRRVQPQEFFQLCTICAQRWL